MSQRCVLARRLAVVISLAASASLAWGKDDTGTFRAQRLVAQALRAELSGNSARRRMLLAEAVDAAPEYRPARWQSGQVIWQGEWLPVSEAQREAAADPKRAQYAALRAAVGNSLDGQLALARWCRKNSFDDEAQFHWRAVLTSQPENDEALRALGVRWYYGRLLTPAEIQAAKDAVRESQAKSKEFAPRLTRWERMLSAGDLKSRDQALAEIRAIRGPNSIAALEEKTLVQSLATNADFERCLEVSQAFVAALDKMPEQAATQSLLRHAVLSPLKSIREASIAALKQRPPHDYVPELLASLAMPIESSYQVITDSSGSVHYFHSLYREGPTADWSFEGRLSAMQHDLQGPTWVTIDDRKRGEFNQERFGAAANPALVAEMESVANANQKRFTARATAEEAQVTAINRAAEATNALLLPVLTATTGQDLGNSPQLWWDWWQRYNEYSSDAPKPVVEDRVAESTHQYYRAPEQDYFRIDPPAPPPRLHSCFAQGTLVWAKTGLRAIESLEIGDLVLAQDVETGELQYKPVIGCTIRPPSPMLTLNVGGEDVMATLGHPFWVAGVGWRMTKQLADGATLHGVKGPVNITATAAAEDAEAYNLIVADFSTYFVGKSGLLVHDNTPRQPTSAKLPGLVDP